MQKFKSGIFSIPSGWRRENRFSTHWMDPVKCMIKAYPNSYTGKCDEFGINDATRTLTFNGMVVQKKHLKDPNMMVKYPGIKKISLCGQCLARRYQSHNEVFP